MLYSIGFEVTGNAKAKCQELRGGVLSDPRDFLITLKSKFDLSSSGNLERIEEFLEDYTNRDFKENYLLNRVLGKYGSINVDLSYPEPVSDLFREFLARWRDLSFTEDLNPFDSYLRNLYIELVSPEEVKDRHFDYKDHFDLKDIFVRGNLENICLVFHEEEIPRIVRRFEFGEH